MKAIRISWHEAADESASPAAGRVATQWLPLHRISERPSRYRARWLSPAEIEVLDSIPVRKRRVEWLGGRIAAKRLVCLELSRRGLPVSPTDMQLLGTKPGGRAGRPRLVFRAPELAARAGPWISDVSLAHTDRYVFSGLARTGRIGVDAEPGRAFGSVLCRTVFTDREVALAQQAFPRLPARSRTAAMWTVKEALLKAYGTGFARGYGTARLLATGRSRALVDLDLPEGTDPGQQAAVVFGRHADHIFAIASVVPQTTAAPSQKGQHRAWH